MKSERSFVASYWEEFYRDGIVAIGMNELGDLSQYPAFRVQGSERIEWVAEPVTPGSELLLPGMRTDISLVSPGRKVVLDAKFYATPLRVGGDGRKKLREDHLYQVFAYLKNLEARGHGAADAVVLLYAASGERFNHCFRVGRHELRACTLDLDQPWPAIRSDLLRLADSLRQPAEAPLSS
jgi:hypothetical protein